MIKFNANHKLMTGVLLVASCFATSAIAQSSAVPANSPTSQTPKGEAGVVPDGRGGVTGLPNKEKSGNKSRSDVQAEARSANKNGRIAKGEAGLVSDGKGGMTGMPNADRPSVKSRAEVRAEARRATRNGEVIKGEAGQAGQRAQRQGRTSTGSDNSSAEGRAGTRSPDTSVPMREGSAPSRPAQPR